MCYDYKTLTKEIDLLMKNYEFAEGMNIGQSIMDKSIPCIRIGKGKKNILLAGAFHGLEYLTAAFLMKFTTNFAEHVRTSSSLFGYDITKLYNEITLFIVPMVNPDGVDIAIHGLDITNPYHRALISKVGIHSFNSVWQANARGVDLNHNYDANWSMSAESYSPTKFGGMYPESEPETRAICDLIRRENFETLIAFHSQGREIYYDFDGMCAENSLRLAEKMAKESGYAVRHPTGTAAFGGCKDWFIKEFGKSGFTVEIGIGKNPLPYSMLEEVYEENARIILCAMEEYTTQPIREIQKDVSL